MDSINKPIMLCLVAALVTIGGRSWAPHPGAQTDTSSPHPLTVPATTLAGPTRTISCTYKGQRYEIRIQADQTVEDLLHVVKRLAGIDQNIKLYLSVDRSRLPMDDEPISAFGTNKVQILDERGLFKKFDTSINDTLDDLITRIENATHVVHIHPPDGQVITNVEHIKKFMIGLVQLWKSLNLTTGQSVLRSFGEDLYSIKFNPPFLGIEITCSIPSLAPTREFVYQFYHRIFGWMRVTSQGITFERDGGEGFIVTD